MSAMKKEEALSLLGFYSCNEPLRAFYEDEHYAELKQALHAAFDSFDYASYADKTVFEIMKEAFEQHRLAIEGVESSNNLEDMQVQVCVPACFVSVWTDGLIIETRCQLNTRTGEAFDIEEDDEGEEADGFLESQTVLYVDGDGERHFFEIDDDRWDHQNETFIEAGELERLRAILRPKEVDSSCDDGLCP